MLDGGHETLVHGLRATNDKADIFSVFPWGRGQSIGVVSYCLLSEVLFYCGSSLAQSGLSGLSKGHPNFRRFSNFIAVYKELVSFEKSQKVKYFLFSY